MCFIRELLLEIRLLLIIEKFSLVIKRLAILKHVSIQKFNTRMHIMLKTMINNFLNDTTN